MNGTHFENNCVGDLPGSSYAFKMNLQRSKGSDYWQRNFFSIIWRGMRDKLQLIEAVFLTSTRVAQLNELIL